MYTGLSVITTAMSKMIPPVIDHMCHIQGLQVNLYKKRVIENVTPITGRGDTYGSNNVSYLQIPDWFKVKLLMDTPTKAGYAGKVSSTSEVESLDQNTQQSSYFITYLGQYGIEWEEAMKAEVFYSQDSKVPEITYQVVKIMEVPLNDNKTMHSGIYHVYLVPFN